MAFSRRLFVLASACSLGLLATGCASTSNAGSAVTGGPVTVPMAAGSADALLYRPSGTGRWPALLVWTDAEGLRPAYAEIGRKLAAAGYVVLIPNAYYRSVKLDGSVAAPALPPAEARERSTGWRTAADEAAQIADSRALIAFLDSQPDTDTTRGAMTLGFDYGSASAFYAARAVPARIGAVAALYPSGTATPRPNSPHLFVNQSRAAYYVALARNDDAREPGDKDDLNKAFADAGLEGTVEVLAADHGFAIPGSQAFDQAAADAAIARALELFASR
ncbi:MAG TPA: dienelactone hydrolase family protein [Croceibacterium sp.]|nr:dienelactone hydrolase family protein [Croceibacterium sp.]